MSGTALAPSKPKALDDMMIAMDVVDTLRHRDDLVRRELSDEARESELIARLRQIYRDQGIEVPDHVLADGVKALKDSRFVYTPPPASWKRTLLTLWTKRETHGKRLGAALGGPDRGRRRLLRPCLATSQAERRTSEPRDHRDAATSIATGDADVIAVASDDAAKQKAATLLADGERAISSRDRVAMSKIGEDLSALRDELTREYTLTFVSRPGVEFGRMAPASARQSSAQLLSSRRAASSRWPKAEHSGAQRRDRRRRDRHEIRRPRAASNVRDGGSR